MSGKESVPNKSPKTGLEFTFYFSSALTLGSAVFVAGTLASHSGAASLKQFYINLSFCQWLFLLIAWFMARTESRSAVEDGISDFWLDEDECLMFIEDYEGRCPEAADYYIDLPLKRWREAQIHYGFYKAFWPALTAWLLSAAAAFMLLTDFSGKAFKALAYFFLAQSMPEKFQKIFLLPAFPAFLNKLAMVATAGNLAALGLGIFLYLRNRRLAAAMFPPPPLVSIYNIKDYKGRSHL